MIHLLASDNPIDHVVDHKLEWIHDSLTMHMVTLVVVGVVAILVLLRAASAIQTGHETLGTDRHLTKGRLSQGLRSLGSKGWAAHLTGGAPRYLRPIMLPIELLGLFIKPVALSIRLFANMVAGHTLMAVIASFGTMALRSSNDWIMSGSISLASVIVAIPISFLELFVALLQAFIFMFLTTVFIGQMTHHHEETEEEASTPEGALVY